MGARLGRLTRLPPERTSRQNFDSERLIVVDLDEGDQLLGRTLPAPEFLAAFSSVLNAFAILSASLEDRVRPKRQ
jgi:hypothetical protein